MLPTCIHFENPVLFPIFGSAIARNLHYYYAMLGLKELTYCPACGRQPFEVQGERSRRCSHCGFELFENSAAANVAFITNAQDDLLVVRRKNPPAKGTLDLPGGFCDAGETAEEAVMREVSEETHLKVVSAEYLFSLPNIYRFSGIDIPTLDLFFRCRVDDFDAISADDDAEDCFFLPLRQVDPEQFGLASIRKGVERFLQEHYNT